MKRSTNFLGPLASLLISVGGTAMAQDAECQVLWQGWQGPQAEDLHVALSIQDLLDGDDYPLETLSAMAFAQLQGGCPTQFQALPEANRTEAGYMGYFLGMNPGLMPPGSDGRVSRGATISKAQFMAVLAAGGVRISPVRGPSTTTTTTQRATPQSQTVRQAVVRRPNFNVVPGCPSCSTTGH